MNPKQLITVLAMAVVFGAPQQALAWPRWMGWLEELSGPGPFTGIRLGVEVACIPDQPNEPLLALSPRDVCTRPLRDGEPLPVLLFEFSRYASKENQLFPSDPRSDFNQVKITSFEPSLMVPINNVVFVGAGVGLQRFSGDAFATFFRASVHGNLRVLPLAGVGNVRLQRLIVLSWVPTLVFPGYDWEDFGAAPQEFSEDVDWLTGRFHVTFNLGELLRR